MFGGALSMLSRALATVTSFSWGGSRPAEGREGHDNDEGSSDRSRNGQQRGEKRPHYRGTSQGGTAWALAGGLGAGRPYG